MEQDWGSHKMSILAFARGILNSRRDRQSFGSGGLVHVRRTRFKVIAIKNRSHAHLTQEKKTAITARYRLSSNTPFRSVSISRRLRGVFAAREFSSRLCERPARHSHPFSPSNGDRTTTLSKTEERIAILDVRGNSSYRLITRQCFRARTTAFSNLFERDRAIDI